MGDTGGDNRSSRRNPQEVRRTRAGRCPLVGTWQRVQEPAGTATSGITQCYLTFGTWQRLLDPPGGAT